LSAASRQSVTAIDGSNQVLPETSWSNRSARSVARRGTAPIDQSRAVQGRRNLVEDRLRHRQRIVGACLP